MLEIYSAGLEHLADIVDIHRQAFGSDEEAELTGALMRDPTAAPSLSLLAKRNGQDIGHILFTRATFSEPNANIEAQILAPLAVKPDAQGQGVGGALVKEGFHLLKERGTDLVFVLGWPDYYPRFGFEPAGRLGLNAPYPILEKNADAWMVYGLKPGVIGSFTDTLRCAEALDQPHFWQE